MGSYDTDTFSSVLSFLGDFFDLIPDQIKWLISIAFGGFILLGFLRSLHS